MVMPPGTVAGDDYDGITAIRYHHKDENGNQYWVFRCRCGKEWICRASFVRTKHTTSCGQGNCASAYKHGQTRPINPYKKEFMALSHAMNQCYNPNDEYYPEVGARGIKVCSRWRDSFQNFMADVGPCPKGKYALQRIDRNKDFKRGNVRWADRMEIGCHMKNNHWITLDGITLHLSEWSRVTGIKGATLTQRLRNGWSVAEALTTSLKRPRGNYQPLWRRNRSRLIELAQRNFQNPKLRRRKRL